MDVEYFRVSRFANSIAVYDCVRLFILLAVGLAVKIGRRRDTIYQLLASQKSILHLALHPQTGMTSLMFAMFGLTAKRNPVEVCAPLPYDKEMYRSL